MVLEKNITRVTRTDIVLFLKVLPSNILRNGLIVHTKSNANLIEALIEVHTSKFKFKFKYFVLLSKALISNVKGNERIGHIKLNTSLIQVRFKFKSKHSNLILNLYQNCTIQI